MTLEKALAYIQDDELVEVTPKSIRLRKKLLDETDRKREDRRRAPPPRRSETSAAIGSYRRGLFEHGRITLREIRAAVDTPHFGAAPAQSRVAHTLPCDAVRFWRATARFAAL